MDEPLASVIIPVYNVDPFLEKCVGSVRAQTYSNLEIILVDDGSSDGSGQMCDRLGVSDLRIRVIHQNNCGAGIARNAALDIAKGVYIYFVDSDDLVKESLVEKTVALMEQHGYDQCIWGMDVVEVNGEHHYWGRGKPLTLRFPAPEQKKKVLCRWQLNYRLGLGLWSTVFRRDIIERNHLRFENEREIGAEDLDFSFRYLACCENLYYLPEAFYVYQRRSGSIMSHNSLKKRAVRMLNMFQREEILLSGQPLFQPFCLYAGVNLAVLAKDFVKDQPVPQGLAQMLACLRSSRNWPYLQKLAHEGWVNRADIRRVCGLRLGGQVCGVYRYILAEDPAPFRRCRQVQLAYEELRDLKSRLLCRH